MDFNEWMNADPDEQRQIIMDSLADTGEVWMGEELDDHLMRSLIGAMRSLSEGALIIRTKVQEGDQPNPYVMGLWANTYTALVKNWAATAAITDVKRKMQKRGEV